MTPVDALAAVPFFASVLDRPGLEKLAARARPREFGKDDVLIRQGDVGSSMLVITDGAVAVSVRERSGEAEVATLGKGDVVGEMSLFTGARRNATVTARRKTSAIEIDKPALEALLVASPELVRSFAAVMDRRDAELQSIHAEAANWNRVGMSRAELIATMTARFIG